MTFATTRSCSFTLRTTILTIWILAYPSLSLPQSRGPSESCPELPGNASDWRAQEHWAWKQICAGITADLGQFADVDKRDMRSQFLETILLREPYRSRIPRQGVNVFRARFLDGIDLQNAKLGSSLRLSGARFEGPVRLRNLEVIGDLSLDGSYAGSPESVDLAGAKISGSLILNRVNALRGINMESLRVGALSAQSAVLVAPAKGGVSMWLHSAKIEGELDMSDSRFDGELEMFHIDVGGDLKLLKSSLTKVNLESAKISGILEIEGPNRNTDHANLRSKNYPALSVDLTDAIVGTLSLGSSWYGPINAPENWGAGSELILTGTAVQTLRDGLCRDDGPSCSDDTWPEHLKLGGFNYQQLESFDAGTVLDMAARPAEWWERWLKRQGEYSPQSYEYLAATLSKLGHSDTAKHILYAGKERERQAAPFPENIELWLERVFIGYGYRLYRSLFWIAGFIIMGGVMLRLSGQGKPNKMPYGIAFSFDLLLPVVRLREYHYDIDLKGWVRYYFYFHKLMGYVLASFLLAGLSGLTK
jgi:hypothetical protein